MFELMIGEKVVMLQFGMHHSEAVSRLNKRLEDGEDLPGYEYLLTFIFAAHENHCKRHEVPLKVTKGEVFAWMEDNNYVAGQAEIYQNIQAAYNASLPGAVVEKKSKVKRA